jgi:transcriptional regulator with XRE-family HTH domain
MSSVSSKNLIDWKLVGRRVRELRGFDITQAEFAKRIGVSQGFLSAVERGTKEAGAEILLRIARQSKRSLDWLITGEDN